MKKRKILMIGPTSVGKTTFKRVFFEKANPLKFLENSLNPTRGIDISLYSFFDYVISIFDLAGQENENWFGKEKQIFKEADAILIIYDVQTSLEEMIQFLIHVIRIKKQEFNQNLKLFLIIHKIDLTSSSYVNLKIKKLKEFISIQFPEEMLNISIFKTSIVDLFYRESFFSVLKILLKIIGKKEINIPPTEEASLKIELNIILTLDVSKHHNKRVACQVFNLQETQLNYHLSRLERLGFIKLKTQDNTKFYFTKTAKYFRMGLEKEKNLIPPEIEKKDFELLYSFLNFEKIIMSS
ncbi:MAG: GTPase domain-containing protein [Promethearchaeota archaeon]